MEKKLTLAQLYCTSASIAFLFSVSILLIWRGIPFRPVLFINEADYFMDFFNSLFHSISPDPYAVDAVYPPLNYVILHFISRFIPEDLLALREFAVRDSQIGMFIFTIHMLLSTGGVLYVIYRNKAGREFERVLFTFLCFMSSGFIYAVVRANMIVLSLLFLLLFIFGKDSKKPVIRELSLVCLAISAAVKIYPALFGLILVKEKRFKECLRTVVYGIACFFLPFFLTGGLSSGVRQLAMNLQELSDFVSSLGFGYSVSFNNTFCLVGALAGIEPEQAVTLARVGSTVIIAVALLSVFFLRDQWKICTLITLLIVAYPTVSYQYTLIFILVPLMLFVDKKSATKKSDLFYLALFLGILIPLFLPDNLLFTQLDSYYPVTVAIFVESLCLVLFTLALILEGFVNAMRPRDISLPSRSTSS